MILLGFRNLRQRVISSQISPHVYHLINTMRRFIVSVSYPVKGAAGIATKNVRPLSHFHNLLAPRNGVLTLFGYGIRVHLDRGHLRVEDGLGADRRVARGTAIAGLLVVCVSLVILLFAAWRFRLAREISGGRGMHSTGQQPVTAS